MMMMMMMMMMIMMIMMMMMMMVIMMMMLWFVNLSRFSRMSEHVMFVDAYLVSLMYVINVMCVEANRDSLMFVNVMCVN